MTIRDNHLHDIFKSDFCSKCKVFFCEMRGMLINAVSDILKVIILRWVKLMRASLAADWLVFRTLER